MKGRVGEGGKLFKPAFRRRRVDIERNRRKEGERKRERERNKIDRKIIIYNSLFCASLSC